MNSQFQKTITTSIQDLASPANDQSRTHRATHMLKTIRERKTFWEARVCSQHSISLSMYFTVVLN